MIIDVTRLTEDMLGNFDKLEDYDRQLVVEHTAPFVLRDGTEHVDGSRGTVRLTPGQLRDLLATVLKAAK